MSETKIQAVKVTLSTSKVAYLRTMKIGDMEVAAQECAARANGDANVLQILMQKSLVKLLLLGVDDKVLKASDKEDMDALFTIQEYGQVLTAVKKMTGGDEMGKEPQLDHVSFGDK